MDALRWEDRPRDLREPVLVAAFQGWNDAAASASSALAFVSAQVGASRVAVIDSEEFFDFQATRPQVDLTTPGAGVTWPDVEVMSARPQGAARDLVLVAGSEPSLRWRTFSGLVLDVAHELGVGMVVTLGALLADVPHTRPVRLTGMASDERLLEGLDLRTPSYAGPTGIVGVLHQAAEADGIPSVSLWAPASHYAAGVTNAKASLALLRGLEAVTGLRVGASELEGAAEAYERQISRAVESDPRLKRLVEQLEEAADSEAGTEPRDLPTGDELARELERFLREQGEEPG
jgi:proteasome assembly chaperone (PAC2) family protein